MNLVLSRFSKLASVIYEAFIGSYRSHYVKRVGTAYRRMEKEISYLEDKKVLIPTTGLDKINLKSDGKKVVGDFNKSKSQLVEELEVSL